MIKIGETEREGEAGERGEERGWDIERERERGQGRERYR